MRSILLILVFLASHWVFAKPTNTSDYFNNLNMTCISGSKMASASTFTQNGSLRVMMTISTVVNGKILNSISDFTEAMGREINGVTELISIDDGGYGNSAFKSTLSDSGATLLIQVKGQKIQLNSLSMNCHLNGEVLNPGL